MRPILFEAFGLRASSAPVFAGLAALVAYLYFERRRRELPYSEDDFWGIVAALAVGVFAGSLGGYALISRAGDWNFAIWSGRFAIPGGTFMGSLPGAALASWAYCRVRGVPYGPAADALAVAAPLGLIVMRLGCVLNGCCHGLPAPGGWGLTFTERCAVPFALRGTALHATQLYEAAGAAGIVLAVELWARPRLRSGALRPGDGMWLSAGLYAALRFVVDFVRAPDPSVARPPLLSLVQWACLAVLAAAAARVLSGRRNA